MAPGPVVGIAAMMQLGRSHAAVSTRPPEELLEEITSP
jgi:hypothetical protein